MERPGRCSGGSSLKFLGGHGHMASTVREPITEVWGGAQVGSRGRAPWSGGGLAPPEAGTFLPFGRSLEATNLSTFLKFGNAKKSQIFVLSLQT